MRRPLSAFAAIFSSGIAAAGCLRTEFKFFYFTGLIFLILSLISFKGKNTFSICLSLAVFALGAAALKNSLDLAKNHVSHFAYYQNNKTYTITGVVKSEPVSEGRNCKFLLEAASVEYGRSKYNCQGKTLVKLNYPQNLLYGDELILTGTLHRPYKGAEAFSYRDYLERQGVYCLMNARLAKLKRHRPSLTAAALFIKHKMEKAISDNLSREAAGIMLAMVLGDKREVSPLITGMMVKTGTVHILVVSGFNVGIVAFISILFLKILRIAQIPRYILTIFILIIYCLMTGSSNPVMRATVMGVFFLAGFLLEREPDIYNALSLAALFILLNNPRQLFDIGFQLSFASVFAIVWIFPKLSAFLKAERLKNKILKLTAQVLLVSLSAWVGTAGFIAYYFRIFTPATVLANVFAVPLATLITLCGFSLVFTSLVLPGFAPYFGSVSEAVIAILLKLNTWIASASGAYCYLSG